MSSRLRPEMIDSHQSAPSNGTAYLMIYTAVQHQKGLIHGRLHGWGAHCAVGSFFEDNPNQALPYTLVDEVAAVNDSVPHFTPAKRKAHVARWLRWKLQQLNFPLVGRNVTKP